MKRLELTHRGLHIHLKKQKIKLGNCGKSRKILFSDRYRWFDVIEEESEKHRFQIYLKFEVIRVFEPSTRKGLLPIIENLS